jgi:hypothetical protein
MRTPVTAWRNMDPARPGVPRVPLPPARMPLSRGGRPLKRWTWVGAFGEDVMLCAAVARIGVVPVSWWAIWDRASGEFAERSRRGGRGVEVSADRVHVPGVLTLEVGEAPAVEVVSPHGDQYAWTRKRGGVPVRGVAAIAGRELEVDLRGLVDESAGYHARHTAWRWSAGVGVLESGLPVAWNLVDGLHDAAGASERTVWVAGEPLEVPPVRFGERLDRVGGLHFSAGPARARRESLLLVSSDYEQPFGTFAGELPGAGPLRDGWGVMERHEARW